MADIKVVQPQLPVQERKASEELDDEIARRYPEQVKLLLSMLRLSKWGGIATVECDDLELRERLFRYFEKQLRQMNIYLYPVEVTEEDLNLVRVLRNLTDRAGFKDLELLGRYDNIVFFVYGMEKYNEEQQEKFLLWLNLFRDATTLIRQPIVLWATSDFINKMAKEAPDFWAWKGMLFRFESTPSGVVRRVKLPPLRRYLQSIIEDPDFSVWSELYVPLRATPLTGLKATDWREAFLQAFLPKAKERGDEAKDVISLVKQKEQIVILGEPGSGKTTVLKYLTWSLAREAADRWDEDSRRKQLVIPIFVRLHQLRRTRDVEEVIWSQFQSHGVQEIKSKEELRKVLSMAPEVSDIIEDRRLRFMIMLDGLNEMPPENRPVLEEFLYRYKDHYLIITSRFYEEDLLSRYPVVVLNELSDEDIERYATAYLGEHRGQRLAEQIRQDPLLRELSRNPLALYMFTKVATEKESPLPHNKGILFQRFTENLLRRTETEWWMLFGRSKSKVAAEISREALAYLGLTMQREKAEVINRERAYWLIRETTFGMSIRASAQDIFEGLIYSGLIRLSRDRTAVGFMHHAVREYFAAAGLLKRGEPISWYLTTPEDLAHWSGTAVLLFGISSEKSLVYWDVVQDGENYNRLWLAARCLTNILFDNEEMRRLKAEVAQTPKAEGTFQLVWGMACELMGDLAEAAEHLEEALRLDSNLVFAYYELGWIYRQLGERQKAVEALKEAINLAPSFIDAHNQLGITYYEEGEYARALMCFQRALALEPYNPHHYYNIGMVHKVLGEYDRAAEAFSKALNIKPDYEDARVQLEIVQKAMATPALKVLDRVYFLQGLSLEQRLQIAERLTPVEYEAGESIIKQGEEGSTFYIIEEGEAEVYTQDVEGNKITLAILREGDYFGEIALLEDTPLRTASVVARTHVKLLSLNKADFDEVTSRFPSITEQLVQTRNERLQRDIKRALEENARYSPLSQLLASLPERAMELKTEQTLTVLIADIHSSTELAGVLGPRSMLRFLREFYLEMIKAVGRQGAVKQYTGDQVLVIFDDPKAAINSAIAMQQAFQYLADRWKQRYPEIKEMGIGIGISTGPVALDTTRFEHAIAGAPVILAARLSARGKVTGEIFMDEATYNLVKGHFPLHPVPHPLIIKGFDKPIRTYRLTLPFPKDWDEKKALSSATSLT